jgi:glycosyltransferase involved in cell wall biosynthesis
MAQTFPLLADWDVTAWIAEDPKAPVEARTTTVATLVGAPINRLVTSPVSRKWVDRFQQYDALPLARLLRTGRHDLVFSPDFSAPAGVASRRYVTVHDLAWRIEPSYTPDYLARFLERTVQREKRLGSSFVAVSATTARDLQIQLAIPDDRISVVPNGVEPRFLEAEPIEADKRKSLGLPPGYVLMVGTLEPRKNHLNVLEAIARGGRSDLPPLVIVGRKGWEWRAIVDAAQPLVDSGRVIILDYVDDQTLPSLYAGAMVSLYPSWYEGFGLPVLESLAAGIPIVASDIPSSREVAGDLACYCDPSDPATIIAAIERALASAQRDALRIGARKARAASFSWDKSADLLASILREQ